MKLGILLVNVLLVAGGIFVYDTLKSDGPRRGSEVDGLDPLTADAPEEPAASGDGTVLVTRGGSDPLAKRNADRLDRLESVLMKVRDQAAARAESASRPTTSDGTLPTLDGRDIVDTDDPVFDEDTLTTISAYMDEIRRRKDEERQRKRIVAELERKDVDISEMQMDSVITETLAYQKKARDLLRSGFPRGEEGRTQRREAFTGLKEEYSAVINRLVPTSEAEKIFSSRVARGLGFMGGGERGNRARRGGRNRGGDR